MEPAVQLVMEALEKIAANHELRNQFVALFFSDALADARAAGERARAEIASIDDAHRVFAREGK